MPPDKSSNLKGFVLSAQGKALGKVLQKRESALKGPLIVRIPSNQKSPTTKVVPHAAIIGKDLSPHDFFDQEP